MPNELFKTENTPADPQGETPQTTDQPSLFHVGEGKKYQTVEDLDKAYGFANEHLGKLEKELAELREAVEEKSSKDGAIEKILAALKGEEEVADQPDAPEHNDTPDVEALVKQLLEQRDAESRQKSNADKVREHLTDVYGDKAAEMYTAKGKELGVDLDKLTAESADAVIAMFPKANVASDGGVSSSVNTSSFQQTAEDPDYAAYKAGTITREERFRRQWAKALKQN